MIQNRIDQTINQQDSLEPKTVLGEIDLTAIKPTGSLNKAYTGISDQISIMRVLYELNEAFLGRLKEWASLDNACRPIVLNDISAARLKSLNDEAKTAISSCGTAVFVIDRMFLAGDAEVLAERSDDSVRTINHFLNSQILAFAKRAISFDREFAAIALSLPEGVMRTVEEMSLQQTVDLLALNQVIKTVPLPAYTPRRSARNRYQTQVLLNQGVESNLKSVPTYY